MAAKMLYLFFLLMVRQVSSYNPNGESLENQYKLKCGQAPIKECCDLIAVGSGEDDSEPLGPSGVYSITGGSPFTSTKVYCDMDTDNGGWTVIQRNTNNSMNWISFTRSWVDYENGFGNLRADFWYGLKAVHAMTQTGQWEMRTDSRYAINQTWSYFHYDYFRVGCASDKYRLSVWGYKGIASHGLYDYHDGAQFSTYDDVNDRSRRLPCAVTSKCGWWYYACDTVNPNERPPEVELPNNGKPVIVDMVDVKIRPLEALFFCLVVIVVKTARHCSNTAYVYL